MKLYAVLRDDLNVPAGKACSQAGHAFLMAYTGATPEAQCEYHKDGMGTKICLRAPNLDELIKLKYHCEDNGIPHYLVVDSGNNTTFGGVTTTSALGIGPIPAEQAEFLRHLPLY